MNKWIEDAAFIFGTFGLVFSLLIPIAAVVYALSAWECSSYEEVTGTPTDYRAPGVCYLQTADGWQRWDEYKARAIASEGLKHE